MKYSMASLRLLLHELCKTLQATIDVILWCSRLYSKSFAKCLQLCPRKWKAETVWDKTTKAIFHALLFPHFLSLLLGPGLPYQYTDQWISMPTHFIINHKPGLALAQKRIPKLIPFKEINVCYCERTCCLQLPIKIWHSPPGVSCTNAVSVITQVTITISPWGNKWHYAIANIIFL